MRSRARRFYFDFCQMDRFEKVRTLVMSIVGPLAVIGDVVVSRSPLFSLTSL